MRNRSNLLVLLGIAFFIVGGIIVYVLTSDDGGDSGGTGAQAQVTVVIPSVDIAAGSRADDLIKDGRLKEKEVLAGTLVPGAVQTLNQLAGATFIQGFASGQQITSNGLQLVNRGYKLAKGYEAQAITLDFTAGDAGYVNVGDKINIYAAFASDPPVKGTVTPTAKLLISGVRVLDVSQAIDANGTQAATGTARGSAGSVTYLLAVKTQDVEKLVFGTKFASLVVTLTDGESPQTPATEGVNPENILDIAPDANATAG